MFNYHRRTEPVIIPYPYLTETTELGVSGVSNTSRPLPSTLSNDQWYLVSSNTSISVASGIVVLLVRVVDNAQHLFWEETAAPSSVALQQGDHVLLHPLSSSLPIITIAGFDLMALGDRTSTSTNNSVIIFPTNIKFRFTESN